MVDMIDLKKVAEDLVGLEETTAKQPRHRLDDPSKPVRWI